MVLWLPRLVHTPASLCLSEWAHPQWTTWSMSHRKRGCHAQKKYCKGKATFSKSASCVPDCRLSVRRMNPNKTWSFLLQTLFPVCGTPYLLWLGRRQGLLGVDDRATSPLWKTPMTENNLWLHLLPQGMGKRPVHGWTGSGSIFWGTRARHLYLHGNMEQHVGFRQRNTSVFECGLQGNEWQHVSSKRGR